MLSKVNYKGLITPIIVGALLWVCTPARHAGISVVGWHMFALFIATIIACITKPLPIAGVSLIAFVIMVITGIVPMATKMNGNVIVQKGALSAFADSTPWTIAMAYMIARGFVKTGLGRRIALIFVRLFGKKTLGLAYSMSIIDLVIAAMKNVGKCMIMFYFHTLRSICALHFSYQRQRQYSDIPI